MGTDVDNRAQRFRELIEPLLNDAYTFARYLARDPSAAEDIVQEVERRKGVEAKADAASVRVYASTPSFCRKSCRSPVRSSSMLVRVM